MKSFPAVLAVLVALVAAAPASAQLPDNSLIRVVGTAPVYRVVGGAPIWLSDCAYIPEGCGAVREIGSLNGYGPYPRDGVTIRNYAPGSGAVYRFAGGAPLWLSKCNAASPCPEQYQVDYGSLDPARYSHARQFPLDGTVVRNIDDGGYYRFAGGAPLLIRCDIGPGCVGPPPIDNGTIESNGTNGATPAHLRQLPDRRHDGARTSTTARSAASPAARRCRSASCDGCAAVTVDNRTFQLAGTAHADDAAHALRAAGRRPSSPPARATFRVAGGAARPAHRLRAARRLRGRGHRSTTARSPALAAAVCSRRQGRHRAARPAVQAHVGDRRRQAPRDVHQRRRRRRRRRRRDRRDPGRGTTPAPVLTPTFTPVISSGYKVFTARYTRFTSLQVRDVPPGSVVITSTCAASARAARSRRAKRVPPKGTR